MEKINAIVECLAKDGVWTGKTDSVKLLRAGSAVGDGTSLYLLGADYILHLSPPKFPKRAEADANIIRKIRAGLSPRAADHVVAVVSQGELDGRSWLLLPLHRPLSANRVIAKLQRQYLRPKVLAWLRSLADHPVTTGDAAKDYRTGLTTLTLMPNMPEAIRKDAHEAIGQIESGEFEPYFTPMHGDLWRGNILFKSLSDFTVIDWGGSEVEGYGIFDLVRYALSDRMAPKQLHAELIAHALIKQIEAAQTLIPLLGAFGHFARNLGEFPESRFISMATGCHGAWHLAIRS